MASPLRSLWHFGRKHPTNPLRGAGQTKVASEESATFKTRPYAVENSTITCFGCEFHAICTCQRPAKNCLVLCRAREKERQYDYSHVVWGFVFRFVFV